MGLPAPTMPVGVPVLDVEAVLARLPAEVRARVAWARKPFKDALDRLRTEALSEATIASATEQILPALAAVGRVSWEHLADQREQARAEMMGDFEREKVRLCEHLTDEDSCDTLEWVIGLLRAFFDVAFTHPTAQVPLNIDDEEWAKAASAPELASFLRGFVTFIAAIDSAKHGGTPERTSDLLDVSFLDLVRFRDAARRHGLWLSPFPYQTEDDRKDRFAHYAERLRDTLTEDDWKVIEQGRLRDLR